MSLSLKISELLSWPREPRQGFPWAFYRLASPGLTTLEIVLAAAIITNMLANNGVLSQETARAVAELAENLDQLKLLPDTAEALAIILVIHRGGNLLMSIIEKVIQPLLTAQRQLGHTEGHAEGHTEGHVEGRTEERTEWRNWLDRRNRAEAEGKPFNEPPPDECE